MQEGAAGTDTRATKQNFLRGDKDAVYYCDTHEPKISYYQSKHKGMQLADVPRIVDYCRISNAGTTIPDPAVMAMT